MKKYHLIVWNGYGHGLTFKYDLKVANIAAAFVKIKEGWKKSSYGMLAPNPRRFLVIQQEDKEVCGIDDPADPLIPNWVNSGYQRIST